MTCYTYFCIFDTDKPGESIFLVIPEDVATGFAAIYGFSPRILTGELLNYYLLDKVGDTHPLRTRSCTAQPSELRGKACLAWGWNDLFCKQLQSNLRYKGLTQ